MGEKRRGEWQRRAKSKGERGRAEGRGGESKKLLPSGQVTPSQDLWEL